MLAWDGRAGGRGSLSNQAEGWREDPLRKGQAAGRQEGEVIGLAAPRPPQASLLGPSEGHNFPEQNSCLSGNCEAPFGTESTE